MKSSMHIQFKPLGLMLIGTAVTAMATCYVAVDSSYPCHEMQMEHCTNGCVRIEYDPPVQSYCDSHDGECGWTDCRIVPATLRSRLLLFKIEADGDGCRCGALRDFTEWMTAGTCWRAAVSGDRCGYCP